MDPLDQPVLVCGYRGTFRSFFRDVLFNLELEAPLRLEFAPHLDPGWKMELVACMIHNGLISGTLELDSAVEGHSYGYPSDDVDLEAATNILVGLIKLF
jgi:hypothetical protein